MATTDDSVRKGHEHYLRHLLLLGQATPVCLNAILKGEIAKKEQTLDTLLKKNSHTFKILFSRECQDLFPSDADVNTNTDSWDTQLLCIVISLLFAPYLKAPQVKALKCINDQIHEFNDHAATASMDYTAFKQKWYELHESILQLLAETDSPTRFKCKHLIHSFKSESLEVNSALIESMKKTKDLKLLVRMAIGEKVVPKVHNCESGTDNVDGEKSVAIRHHLDDMEVFENTDTVLTCKVNKKVDMPVWFYNCNEITPSVRFEVSSLGLSYSLSIYNVNLGDEGEYTVWFKDIKSTATLKVKGKCNLSLRYQLTQELYRNWVLGALGLKFLKQGIEGVAQKIVHKQHSLMIKELSHVMAACHDCTPERLLPYHADKASDRPCPHRNKRKCICSNRKQLTKLSLCPNSTFCSQFYDLMIRYHRFNNPELANTEICKWSEDSWSVATCFINTPGYKNRKSEKEIDCSGLLSLIINDKLFEEELGDVFIDGNTDVFKRARDARNEILHNPRYELTEGELKAYIHVFKNVLEVKNVANQKPLKHEAGVQEALQNLDMLYNYQIDVSMTEDIEADVKHLRENAMNDVADIIEKSKKETDIKLQAMQERLKEATDELRLLRILHSQMQERIQQEPETSSAIQQLGEHATEYVIVESEAKKPDSAYLNVSLDVAFESMETTAAVKDVALLILQDFICNQGKLEINETTTDVPSQLKNILRQICTIPGVEICDVLSGDNGSVTILTKCSSSVSIYLMIKFFNGQQLQDSLFSLRKCLETEYKVSCIVNVHITKESFDKVKIDLGDCADIEDPSKSTCEKHADMQNDWYCPDHEEFHCVFCKDDNHRMCQNVRSLSLDAEVKAKDKCLYVKEKMEVDISDGGSFNKYPVIGCCALPNGEILVTKMEQLIKLDSSLHVLCRYDYRTSRAKDVCYMGNDLAVVSLQNTLRFLNIEGNDIRTVGEMELFHDCNGLACSGTGYFLYFTDSKCIYTVHTNKKNEQKFYEGKDKNSCIYKVVVSDNGERIFILNGYGSIITVDRLGEHLATLQTKEVAQPRYACSLQNGTLIVCDYHLHTLIHIDSEGQTILGTIADDSNGIKAPICVCYDRKFKRIIVCSEEVFGHLLTFCLK